MESYKRQLNVLSRKTATFRRKPGGASPACKVRVASSYKITYVHPCRDINKVRDKEYVTRSAFK